jgi:hypothetical protein
MIAIAEAMIFPDGQWLPFLETGFCSVYADDPDQPPTTCC